MLLCLGSRLLDNSINEDFVPNLFLYLMLIEHAHSLNWVRVFSKHTTMNQEKILFTRYIIFINQSIHVEPASF